MLGELNVKDFPNSWPKLTSTSGRSIPWADHGQGAREAVCTRFVLMAFMTSATLQ
jgi:hypothetical protein